MSTADLVAGICATLEPLANAERADQQQAYLRDQFRFLGIATPQRRSAIAAFSRLSMRADEVLQLAQALWPLPYREYKYVAIDLLASRHKLLTADALPALLGLAQSGSWWETVDGLAGVIGDVVCRERKSSPATQLLMDESVVHPDMWVRRIAMTHQLGWRLQTDEQRLFGYATTLACEQEFFICKAIGWALRDYARWNPVAVKQFLESMDGKLSALTVREASKRL